MNKFMLHMAYLLAGAMIGAMVAKLIGVQGATKFVSLTTAYASLSYMAVALLIGPWRVLNNRRPVVSLAHRRNFGIWSGVFALVHMTAGLNSHYQDRMWSYFVLPNGGGPLGMLRTDLFGIANYLGLFGIFIVIVLLALSNNSSIHKLGVFRWKSVQRMNYLLFTFVVLHVSAYLVLENRQIAVNTFVGLVSLIVVSFQLLGFVRHQSTSRRLRN